MDSTVCLFVVVLQIISAEIVIEPVTEPVGLGKELYWDVDTQTIYYVDVFNIRAHRYVPSTNTHTSVKLAETGYTGVFIPRIGSKDKFLAAVDDQLLVVQWDGVSDKAAVLDVVFDEGIDGNGLSDALENENGHFWIGSYGKYDPETRSFREKLGHVYSLNRTRHVTKHLDSVTISTSMTWSKDNKKFYHIDTLTLQVHVYDFDPVANKISNKQVFIDLRDHKDIKQLTQGIFGPDGMTHDTDGNIWLSIFNSGCILKLDPNTAKILQRVDVPTAPTLVSLVFGGPNLDVLYVSTSKQFLSEEELNKYPDSGKVMKITGLGVKGYPSLPSIV